MILGNLPKLIVHANEHKVQAMRSIYDTVVGYWAQTPFRTPDAMNEEFLSGLDVELPVEAPADVNDSVVRNDTGQANLFLLQFIVDQLALEVIIKKIPNVKFLKVPKKLFNL